MIDGAITLGLNDAYGGRSPNPPYTRQPLPSWKSAGRARPANEPFPAWVGPFGHWAAGPGYWHYSHYWELAPVWRASHGGRSEEEPGRGGGCLHLTLAGNCHIEKVHGNDYIRIGVVREYNIRPYRWSEELVQAAYEAVSDGAVGASDVSALAEVGKTGRTDTPDEILDAQAIHDAWDSDVASYLAFGPEDKRARPIAWPGGDTDMAGDISGRYSAPSPYLYGSGRVYYSWEDDPSGTSGMSGQGFFAWRKGTDGSPDADDWSHIGSAILESADGRPSDYEAFDLHILKRVRLVRGKYRSVYGKEQSKTYTIDCWRISGARPAVQPCYGIFEI